VSNKSSCYHCIATTGHPVAVNGVDYRTLVQAFISCRLDYCNSVFYSISAGLLRRLQSVHNAAARLVTGPQNLTYSLHEAVVVTTGEIDSNPAWKLNGFLAHQSANVGFSHRCRYQRCAILYLRRSLCRRLRPVSARVRSLVVESNLCCGRCSFNTPFWPSDLSLDGRALVAPVSNRLRRKFLSGSGTCLTYRRRLAWPGGLGGDGTP